MEVAQKISDNQNQNVHYEGEHRHETDKECFSKWELQNQQTEELK